MARHSIRSLAEKVIVPILVGLVVVFVSNLIHFNFRSTIIAILLSVGLSVAILYSVDKTEKRPVLTVGQEPPKENAESASRKPAGNNQDLIPARITPRYLVDLFRGYQHHEATKVIRPYIHKQMRFRGTVFSVHDDGCLFITSESMLGDDRVFAYFDDDEFNEVTILLKDKKITVQGELVGADTFNVELRHCKIVEQPKIL